MRLQRLLDQLLHRPCLEDGFEGLLLLDLNLTELLLPAHELPLPLLQLKEARVQLHVEVIGTLQLALVVLPDVLGMPAEGEERGSILIINVSP